MSVDQLIIQIKSN